MKTVTKIPSIQARIDELVVIAQGLALELEATRKQVAFIGEIAQDMLKTAVALKGRIQVADPDQLKN